LISAYTRGSVLKGRNNNNLRCQPEVWECLNSVSPNGALQYDREKPFPGSPRPSGSRRRGTDAGSPPATLTLAAKGRANTRYRHWSTCPQKLN